jgi:tripartite-type tricarboxylate transporter receptor subunit TctC
MKRPLLCCILSVAWILAYTSVPYSQNVVPDQGTKIVHPFAAGGVGFDLGHVLSQRLKALYDMTVVVEPRPGGNTTIGALSVINSDPDGRTLLITATSILATSGSVYKKPPYNPLSDLVPVAYVARLPLILVANSELPIRSPKDIVKLAASTPAGLTFSSAGTGGAQHLSGELLKRTLRSNLRHVPYRGPVAAVTAVAGGHVTMMFADSLNALPLLQAGKIRAVAVTTTERTAILPELPTMAELGYPGFGFDLRLALFAPAKTPADVVSKLNSRVKAALSDESIRKRYASEGVLLIDSPSPADAAVFYGHELDRWKKLLEEAGLTGTQ